jgi:hypothetical protein
MLKRAKKSGMTSGQDAVKLVDAWKAAGNPDQQYKTLCRSQYVLCERPRNTSGSYAPASRFNDADW